MWWWWLEKTCSNFKGLNITELNTDEAWLNISSSYEKPLWIYSLSEDCYTCSYQKFLNEPILHNHSYKAIVNTQHGKTFRFRTSGDSNYTPSVGDSFAVCDVHSSLGEFGVYSVSIHSDDQTSVQCSLTNDLEPVNIYLPIFVTFVFWIFLGFVFKYSLKHLKLLPTCFKKIWETLTFSSASNQHENEQLIASIEQEQAHREPENADNSHKKTSTRQERTGKRKKKAARVQERDQSMTPVETSRVNEPSSSTSTVTSRQDNQADSDVGKERLKSLDAFRGICILIMIIADDGGGGYYFLEHCTWDGLYVADLAFPWFLWICGVCIPLSMHSRITSGTSKIKIAKEILIRSLKLILLGIMANTFARDNPIQLELLRLPGVLQRFGLCYFIGSILLLIFYDKGHSSSSNASLPDQNYFKDFKTTIVPWFIVITCVIVHSAITFFLPVPHCPLGYLGPAGLHNDSALSPQCVGGATGYIDRLIFGIQHMYNHPTSSKVYGSGAFDPEGILGVLTSVLHIWLGIQAGITVQTYRNVIPRLIRLLSWSLLCGVGGYLLCGGLSNSGWIPINKNLWSLSFVLVTCSAALALLVILYLIIDVYGKWKGTPLVETGRNSILLYLGHNVCSTIIPWNFSYGRMASHTSELMETAWGTALWIIIAVYLHDQQLFFVV